MRAACLCRCLLLATLPIMAEAQIANGQISYYQVMISDPRPYEYRTGYGRLDWSNRENVRGELCLDRGEKRSDPIRLAVQGKNPRDGELLLNIPAIPGLTFAAQPFRFTRGSSALFTTTERTTTAWDYFLPSSGDPGEDEKQPRPYVDSVTLTQIPSELRFLAIRPETGDASYRIGSASGPKYALSNYDRLSKEQVLALERARRPHVSDGGHEQGVVLAVVRRDALKKLRDFLSAEGGGATFEDPSFQACGAPFVMLSVEVAPLLEFYYARKLQVTGLVISAFVKALGAGPSFSYLGIDDRRFVRLLDGLDLSSQHQQLWTLLLGHVRAFVDARRPDFQPRGTISRLERGNGQAFAYRMELTGPALSECTRNRWEKLILQILVQNISINGNIFLVFQIQEGFFAPGSLDRRPDDSRLRENRISDGELEQLQDRLLGFLVARGFFAEDGNTSANADVGCRF